jgi:hypothetical protein
MRYAYLDNQEQRPNSCEEIQNELENKILIKLQLKIYRHGVPAAEMLAYK